MLKGNAVIGQSGGPTSVINSSLAGVISACRTSSSIRAVYGMQYGIEGLMQDRLLDLSAQSDDVIWGLQRTPSSALGSSRYKLREEDFPAVLEVLKKHDIRYFFLIGGNDTMDTINKVESWSRSYNYELTGVVFQRQWIMIFSERIILPVFLRRHGPTFLMLCRPVFWPVI